MSRDKKWSSNDKNQLLVENFRKFMEEGDFSAPKEMNEIGGLWRGMKRGMAKLTGNEGLNVKSIKKSFDTASAIWRVVDDLDLSNRPLGMLTKSVANELYLETAMEKLETLREFHGGKNIANLEELFDSLLQFKERPQAANLSNLLTFPMRSVYKELLRFENQAANIGKKEKKSGDDQVVEFAGALSQIFVDIAQQLEALRQSPEFVEISNLIKMPEEERTSKWSTQLADTTAALEKELKFYG